MSDASMSAVAEANQLVGKLINFVTAPNIGTVKVHAANQAMVGLAYLVEKIEAALAEAGITAADIAVQEAREAAERHAQVMSR